MSVKNRRKEQRLDSNLNVFWESRDPFEVEKEKEKEKNAAVTKNISSAGAWISGSGSATVGSVIKLFIRLPSAENTDEWFETEAIVRRAIGTETGTSLAVEFMKMSEQELEKLKSALNFLNNTKQSVE